MKQNWSSALKNIRRAPFQALGSIFMLFLTFAVAQAFVLVMFGTKVVLEYFEKQPQVTAFFTDKVDEPSIMQLKQQLEHQSYVSKVKYVSKAEALQIYKNDNKNDPLLLEMVTADILPASLEVSAINLSFLPKIKDYLSQVSGIDEVVYQKDVIDTLQKTMHGVRTGGLALVIFLVATSLLITTIIITMKVAAKRQEIRIMRLLGATSWFVRGPFIVEGIIYGVVSATIAWAFIYTAMLYATPILVSFLGDIPLLPIPITIMLALLGGSVGAGFLIGSIAGSLSTSRYE